MEAAVPRARSHVIARIAQGLGEVMLTLGMVLLLLVVYQLFWTGVETHRAQDTIKNDLYAQWGVVPPSGSGLGVGPAKEPEIKDFQPGDGIGMLRIPRFGLNYAWAIVEGTSLDDLARGPGHYVGTALPGEVGNFAVAGHRATHGEPFARFEELRVGDPIVVETATRWYTYEVFEIDYPVPIDSMWATAPDPQNVGAAPTEAKMTLTTCHPRWASTSRFLVFTRLTETLDKAPGVTPAALQ
jgi:sortase A